VLREHRFYVGICPTERLEMHFKKANLFDKLTAWELFGDSVINEVVVQGRSYSEQGLSCRYVDKHAYKFAAETISAIRRLSTKYEKFQTDAQ